MVTAQSGASPWIAQSIANCALFVSRVGVALQLTAAVLLSQDRGHSARLSHVNPRMWSKR